MHYKSKNKSPRQAYHKNCWRVIFYIIVEICMEKKQYKSVDNTHFV